MPCSFKLTLTAKMKTKMSGDHGIFQERQAKAAIPRKWLLWVGLVLACAIFALGNAFSWYPSRRTGSYGPNWSQALGWELLRWFLWFPLGMLILRAERWLQRRAKTFHQILWGAAAILGLALLHTVLLVALYFPFSPSSVTAFFRYWQSCFGGDAKAVGKTIRLNRHPVIFPPFFPKNPSTPAVSRRCKEAFRGDPGGPGTPASGGCRGGTSGLSWRLRTKSRGVDDGQVRCIGDVVVENRVDPGGRIRPESGARVVDGVVLNGVAGGGAGQADGGLRVPYVIALNQAVGLPHVNADVESVVNRIPGDGHIGIERRAVHVLEKDTHLAAADH